MRPLKKKQPPLTIHSDRIWLQKHDLKQAQVMFDYVQKDKRRLRKFLPWPDKIKSVKDEQAFIKAMSKAWKSFENFDFGIFRRVDGVYMGNLGVHSIRWDRHYCEIGYWILGDFEGHGYMTEAVKCLEAALFKIGFNRVQIRCSSINERSANVPRACGYVFEGTHRQDGVDLGKFRDTHVFSKLKSEWKKSSRKTKG